MKKIYVFILFSFLFSLQTLFVHAQSSKITCEDNMTGEYISDGQYYKTKIKSSESKDFKVTFIGKNTYRVIVCSESTQNVTFKLKDQLGNVLFANSDFNNTTFWDFEIQNTIECTLSITYNNPQIPIDNVVVLIGFKK